MGQWFQVAGWVTSFTLGGNWVLEYFDSTHPGYVTWVGLDLTFYGHFGHLAIGRNVGYTKMLNLSKVCLHNDLVPKDAVKEWLFIIGYNLRPI